MKNKAVIFALLATAMLLQTAFSGCTVISEPPMAIDNCFIVSNSRRYLADERILSNGVGKLTASLAKNEAEGMQFQLNFGTDVKNVSVSMTQPSDGNGNVIEKYELFKEHYYSISKTIAAYPKSGQYPDALIPIGYADTNSVDILAGKNQGFWITVTSKQGQAAGIYTAEVTVTYDGGVIKIPVEIEVWDFELPEETPFETYYGANVGGLMRALAYTGSDEGVDSLELEQEYMRKLLEYRINPGYMCGAPATDSPEEYADLIKSYLDNPRIQNISLSNIDRTMDFQQQQDGSYKLSDYWVRVLARLREYAVLDKLVAFVIRDEPPDTIEYGNEARAKKEALEAVAPEVRTIATTAPKENFYGGIDTWCGIWSSSTTEQEMYVEDRLDLGETVTWYGCIAPQAPFPTYHIQDALMTSRLVHWMQKDWQISGNLYWSATLGGYKYNEYTGGTDTRDQWTDAFAFPYAAGDGYLIYVGGKNDGIVNRNIPVSSMRMESVRDGTEDNIYLTILQNKIQDILDKYGISDIDADAVMDTFYTPLYNTMGDFDHDKTLMLKTRELLAHAIMADDDFFICTLPAMTQGNLNRREVRVYGEPNTDILIDGNAVAEENHGSYSTYSAFFSMAEADIQTVTVSVDGQEYERILKGIEDYEYMELENDRVKQNVLSLELPLDYIEVRAQNIENMFTPEITKDIGTLDNQLGSMGEAVSKVERVISESEEVATKIRECICVDISNTIPLVVTNEDVIDSVDQLLNKRLTLYVPHGATLKVEGNLPTQKEQTEKYDVYTYDISTKMGERYVYDVEVSYGGKTETYKKVVLQKISYAQTLVDLTNETTLDVLVKQPLNKFGTGMTVTDGKMLLNFAKQQSSSDTLRRVMIDTEALTCGSDMGGYTAICFMVKNVGTETKGGISIRVSAGSSNDRCGESGEIEPGQTKIVFAYFPDVYLENPEVLENISGFSIFETDPDNSGGLYEISNIVSLKTDFE